MKALEEKYCQTITQYHTSKLKASIGLKELMVVESKVIESKANTGTV
jgi:hypothetical protein